MIKYVFLDLDDTILDFHKAEKMAISDTFRAVGIEPTDRLIGRYSEINREHWERLERGELSREQVLFGRFDCLYREIGVGISPQITQSVYEESLSEKHPFIENAIWLLEELYGKYKLYIASNGTARVQDRRIAEADIEGYFNGIFISQRIGYNKPRKEFFDGCFEQIEGFSRNEAIIVGDSLTSDILGGINAGIKTCRFNPKNLENTTDIIPDYEIKSLKELPELLRNI